MEKCGWVYNVTWLLSNSVICSHEPFVHFWFCYLHGVLFIVWRYLYACCMAFVKSEDVISIVQNFLQFALVFFFCRQLERKHWEWVSMDLGSLNHIWNWFLREKVGSWTLVFYFLFFACVCGDGSHLLSFSFLMVHVKCHLGERATQ